MLPSSDRRYTPLKVLARRDHRQTLLAVDQLSGDPVVIKRQPFEEARLEARCLLALPASAGPKIRDVRWAGKRRLHLVLERIQGNTLRATSRETLETGIRGDLSDPRALPLPRPSRSDGLGSHRLEAREHHASGRKLRT